MLLKVSDIKYYQFFISSLGVSHVRIYGPSIAAVDDNITYIVHILNDDEVPLVCVY